MRIVVWCVQERLMRFSFGVYVAKNKTGTAEFPASSFWLPCHARTTRARAACLSLTSTSIFQSTKLQSFNTSITLLVLIEYAYEYAYLVSVFAIHIPPPRQQTSAISDVSCSLRTRATPSKWHKGKVKGKKKMLESSRTS